MIVKQGFAGICRVSIREGKVLTSDVFFPKIPDIHWYGSAEDVWQAVFSYFITYYYAAHPQQIPREIICENAIQDEQILLDFLKETSGYPTRFLKPSRGQKKDWLAFANNNLTIAIKAHENSWNLIQHRYHALAKFINIKTISRMECFDISHTQGAQTVASCVVFDAQGPYKKDYRHYHIQDITPGDDYAAMKQVLERRCKYYLEHPNQIPQLVIIDGGKGQVNIARDVLKDFIHQGLIVLGVSKGPSRKAGMEKLLIANENIEQTLAKDNEALHLLQHIRDESHRFAITFHRNRRQKKSLESSLEKIPGVGGGRRKLLLQRFGGLRELRGASIEEIAKVSSIGYDLAKRIFEHLREN